MSRISPARATARAHMLMEAADHLGADVCTNPLERQEADKIAEKLRKEASIWYARGLKLTDMENNCVWEYDDICRAEFKGNAK